MDYPTKKLFPDSVSRIQEPDANGTPVQIYSGITENSFSWSTNITSGT